MTLEGIDLADGDGQPAVHLDRLTVRYRLGALGQRTLHITSVELEGGRVQARQGADGQPNLATLTRPSPEPQAAGSGRLPIAIVVDAITLGSGLSFAGPPGPLHQVAAELTLAAGLRIDPDLRIALRIDRLSLPTQTPLKSQLSLAGECRWCCRHRVHPPAAPPGPTWRSPWPMSSSTYAATVLKSGGCCPRRASCPAR